MQTKITSCNFYAAIAVVLLSIVALSINSLFYQYPGNNYFPHEGYLMLFSLVLMYSGFTLQFGRVNQLTLMLKEALYFFLVMTVIAVATNAMQYTPFPVIDHHIVAFESLFHLNMKSIVAWTNSHPVFTPLLARIYDTLPLQMCYLPLLVIAAKRFNLVREYYFLLLSSALIGFTFYYFFPTTAPASVIDSSFFSEAQRATGLKFQQLHHYIQPSTIEGGMIALPSFHVVWAWFGLYLVRGWPIAFGILLPVNILLVASCVLLGWHYPIDILGSLVIIAMAHGLHHFFHERVDGKPSFQRLINNPH